ncbi:uncharacterized protein EV422DRAFT_600930 [Fimicolochytrium jonesii]|uniref:uncharacterized protein n=1 Tax=Fimicolochytrium jonesii TaxID=1396493 RepID=UPI0022FE4538|nr:uncharacterized protein EV422DRAFT_600930 [Fimicolochytrium jonesii]KAI8826099.1 hypothetical protein EV422DRAFT_600930 [Fimicolochytrium jonesii]
MAIIEPGKQGLYSPPAGPPPPPLITYSPPAGPPPPWEAFRVACQRPQKVQLGIFDNLPEELIVEDILPLLSPHSIETLSRVCRAFQVHCRDDQLWRRICLAKDEEADEEAAKRFRALTGASNIPPPDPGLFPYSFAKWCRCHMNLSGFNNSSMSNGIQRGSSHDFTAEQFQSRFESLSIPLLIGPEYVKSNWTAMKKWTMASLLEQYEHVRFKVGNEYGNPRKVDMSFGAYTDYMIRQNDESPLYVFDSDFAEKASSMLEDYAVPPMFSDDLLQVLGDDRPDYRWLVIGPSRSGASWHVDPLGTSAWNALISGRKRWALYPPEVTPPGVDDDEEGMSSLEWYLEVYPYLPSHMKPIEVIQEPGEIIFVPAGWWHLVLNIDPCNIAVTQNWASRWNLSGVVSEMADSGKPKLREKYQRFRDAIMVSHPEFASTFTTHGPSTDPIILSEGYSTRSDFHEGFDSDADKWIERINMIWASKFPTSSTVLLKDVIPLSTGINPVYFHAESNHIVKFYSHLGGGKASFHSEASALSRLSAHTTKGHSFFPALLASGTLADLHPRKFDAWSWPYTVQSNDGALETLSMGDVCAYFTDIHWTACVDSIAAHVRALHQTPRASDLTDVRLWSPFLQGRIERAEAEHARWGHVPPVLLRRLNEFIGTALSCEIEAMASVPAVTLLHGDLTPGNIIGRWNGLDIATWMPTQLIDFGDSLHCVDDTADPMIGGGNGNLLKIDY